MRSSHGPLGATAPETSTRPVQAFSTGIGLLAAGLQSMWSVVGFGNALPFYGSFGRRW